MELKDFLDVDFINYGEDKQNNPNIDPSNYRRVHNSWNVYFHGFMCRYDDIAYVKKPVVIEPGIYPIKTYGIDAYLFIWIDEQMGRHRGLITRQSDERSTADAYEKYLAKVTFL